jgi:hypothetical protein
MTDRAAFTQLIDQDIAALRRCDIGVVWIGPIRSLEGFGRQRDAGCPLMPRATADSLDPA